MFIVVAGGGSLLMIQQRGAVSRSTPAAVAVKDVPSRDGLSTTRSPAGSGALATPEQPTHTLALAAGVDGLSDGDLRQLMNDMDSFDALPSAEPEPVLSVDGDNLDQGI